MRAKTGGRGVKVNKMREIALGDTHTHTVHVRCPIGLWGPSYYMSCECTTLTYRTHTHTHAYICDDTTAKTTMPCVCV